MPLTPNMIRHLKEPYRNMAWLMWIERPAADLYLWSGDYHMTYGGNIYLGFGYITKMETIRRSDSLEHTEQVFELNGLDPTIIADLDESVRGLSASIWLAGLGRDRQVIREPLLLTDSLVQDTLGWTYSADSGMVTLRLTCFDALPFLGRATGKKWSNDSQVAEFAGDTGFSYNTAIALAGPAVEWTAP